MQSTWKQFNTFKIDWCPFKTIFANITQNWCIPTQHKIQKVKNIKLLNQNTTQKITSQRIQDKNKINTQKMNNLNIIHISSFNFVNNNIVRSRFMNAWHH